MPVLKMKLRSEAAPPAELQKSRRDRTQSEGLPRPEVGKLLLWPEPEREEPSWEAPPLRTPVWAARIERLRRSLNDTQPQFGRRFKGKLGRGVSTLETSDWEFGSRCPNADNIAIMASLAIDPDDRSFFLAWGAAQDKKLIVLPVEPA